MGYRKILTNIRERSEERALVERTVYPPKRAHLRATSFRSCGGRAGNAEDVHANVDPDPAVPEALRVRNAEQDANHDNIRDGVPDKHGLLHCAQQRFRVELRGMCWP